MTVADLEKLSLQFRNIVSRARRSSEDDARSNLKRLLAFVRDTPLFALQIEAAPHPEASPMIELERARGMYARLNLPISREEELGFLHALLTELAEAEGDFFQLAYHYGGKTNFREAVSELLDGTINPYYEILVTPINDRLIEHKATMTGGQNDSTVIHVNGGTSQINLARDQAQITAMQQVRMEAQEVCRLAESLVAEVERHRGQGIPDETLDELKEIGETVAEQVQLPAPRKGVLKRLGAGLSDLTGTVQGATGLAKAAGGLYKGLEPFISALT